MRFKNIPILIFTIIFLFNSKLDAQNNCYVHLNKDFYVTGEYIWYKLSLPKSVEGISAIIKTSMVDKTGKTISEDFNPTEELNFISGYYKIPFEIESNYYKLIFSGSLGKEADEVIFASVFVPVYNDLESLPENMDNLANNVIALNTPIPNGEEVSMQINLDKESYNSREQINATVLLSDSNGNPINGDISISIIDNEIASSQIAGSSVALGNTLEPSLSSQLKNQIYLKGSYVKGENEIVPKEILAAYVPSQNQLQFSVPNMLGNFYMELPNFYGAKSIQFFPYIDDGKDLKINFDKLSDSFEFNLPYTEQIVEYIKLSRQRKKLYQRYNDVETKLNISNPKEKINQVYFDKAFDLTEYKQLENMASFLKEVKTPLRMKEKKDKYIGSMYMLTKWKSYSDYAEGNPMYIVDGRLTRNSDYIGRIAFDLVTNLEMLYTPKKIRDAYKIFGTNGVVRITTNSNDILIPKEDSEDIFNISGLLPKAEFPAFNPSTNTTSLSQPIFKPQLYWNPNLSTSNGKADFSFYQSDDVSTFVIEAVAHTADGKMYVARKTYEATWQ